MNRAAAATRSSHHADAVVLPTYFTAVLTVVVAALILGLELALCAPSFDAAGAEAWRVGANLLIGAVLGSTILVQQFKSELEGAARAILAAARRQAANDEAASALSAAHAS